MEFNIRKILKDIRSHLAGLTVSQKMLIGTLVVVIGGGLLWLVSWAGAPERAPLLDQPMSQEEMGRMTAGLSAMGVDYKVEGDRILVPASRRSELLGRLSSESALPSRIENGFEKLFESTGSMFDTQTDRELKKKIALQNELARCLAYWPGVNWANVIIDKDSKPDIGKPAGDVTANVTLRFNGGYGMSNQMGRNVARFVSSAVGYLKPERVTVADATHGRTFSPEPAEEGYGTILHELREEVDKRYNQKLGQGLSHIPGVRTILNVELSDRTIERVQRVYDKEKSIATPFREEESRSSSTTGRPGGATGVTPNVNGPMSIGDGGGGGKTDSNSSKSFILPGQAWEQLTESIDKGGIERIDASIMLPSNYIIKVARAMSPSLAQDPGFRASAEYQAALKAETDNARKHAAGALGIEEKDAEAQIRVSDFLYTEGDATAKLAAAGEGGGPMDGVGAVLNQFGKPALLGVIALVSLFLVASMVKRAAPAPLVIREKVAEEGVHEEVAGEAERLEGVLPGIEVDEDTLRVNSMVEQVNEMINENLESATGLVRRWIAEDS